MVGSPERYPTPTDFLFECSSPLWSANGSTLYFYRERPSPSFRKISLNSAESSKIVRGWTWKTQAWAQVDPNGKLIVYSKREKGVPVGGSGEDWELSEAHQGPESPLLP